METFSKLLLLRVYIELYYLANGVDTVHHRRNFTRPQMLLYLSGWDGLLKLTLNHNTECFLVEFE